MAAIELTVLIKGAGDLASGVALRLHRGHFRLLMTELDKPLAVRRTVSFCEAIYDGQQVVEGVKGVRCRGEAEVREAWRRGEIPLLADPGLECLAWSRPQVLVEATLSKRNTGLRQDMAPLVIALGPGFQAGQDAHLVVETQRGHDLGRIYEQGFAQPDSGVPGEIAGFSWQRVLRSPAQGLFETGLELGALVSQGQEVARVAGQPVLAEVGGVLRGLIRPGAMVSPGLKVGDVDPRCRLEYLHTVSDKARALGGAVLEAVLGRFNC